MMGREGMKKVVVKTLYCFGCGARIFHYLGEEEPVPACRKCVEKFRKATDAVREERKAEAGMQPPTKVSLWE